MTNSYRLEYPTRLSHRRVNVSDTERIVTGIGGLLLAVSGLRHGGISGLLGAIAGGALVARATTGHCPAYARLGSSASERRLAERSGWHTAAVTRESIVIRRPREALYAFWRDFRNLSRVMSHVERIDVLDSQRSHWVASLPMGKTLEWDSRITDDRPNERIAWESTENAELHNSGWVRFRDAPDGLGTEVLVQLAYEPPGGELGRSLVKLWPDAPGALLKHDLNELRRSIESGELALGEPGALPGARGDDAGASRPH